MPTRGFKPMKKELKESDSLHSSKAIPRLERMRNAAVPNVGCRDS